MSVMSLVYIVFVFVFFYPQATDIGEVHHLAMAAVAVLSLS
jgi:hypothetical protein